MLKAIEEHAPEAKVTIADGNADSQLSIINYQLLTGPDAFTKLTPFKVLIKSPGIPSSKIPEEFHAKLTNSTQIFLDTVIEAGAQVIGVTGSKGKSTTASLIALILEEEGLDVHLVGNIGEPSIGHISEAKEGTQFVLEMSSYQLMHCTVSPQIAVITSVFPEHLDYHGSMEEYMNAKKHITRFQTAEDFAFYDATSADAETIAQASPGTPVACAVEDSVVRLDETQLLGEHNLKNIALASVVAEHFHIERQTVRKAIAAFPGLPHRLQNVGVHHGIRWVDDSISTTPETAIAALDALGDDVKVILLGGQDRGSDFTKLGERIAKSGVEHVILFPETGPRIREATKSAKAKAKLHEVKTMEEAVKIARSEFRIPNSEFQIPICLLSPASPSYGMFRDFEERGDVFKKYIEVPA